MIAQVLRQPRSWAVLSAVALLAACVSMVPGTRPGPATTPAPTSTAASAALLGVARGAPIASFGLLPRDSAAALDAFEASCGVLTSTYT